MARENQQLPQLRQDLEILKGGATSNGAPYWLVHDRVKNSYYRISDQYMKLLGVWQPVEPDALVQRANAIYPDSFSSEDVTQLTHFLFANSLTTTPVDGGYKGYLGQALAGKKSWWMSLIHNYLFFRIPIARPQGFLDKTWPYVSFLFTRPAVICFVLIAVIGLYLVSRQWAQFLSTFASFLSFEGFTLYAVSLVLIKSLHEMGHAFMAKRYGVEVPTIGAAFIVMMPILYTNTTGAWRLSDPKQRLMIDAAGIFTELAIASICTILWVFLPEGNMRAIAFSTATVSWILSLMINLNPFMKFDGYYILSDALDFENLQSRGFALAKWWIREKLFGLSIPPVENLEPKLRNFVIAHAIGVWIYRFFLFLGIALLVYHFFFKVLGVFMFAIEMIWFIGLPIWREIKEWLKMKNEIQKAGRYKWTGAILASLIFAMAIPWSTTIIAPALMGQANETALHAPYPARLKFKNFTHGMNVKTGQILIQFQSDDLDHNIANTKLEHTNITARLARAHVDAQDRSQIQVLREQYNAVDNKLEGLHLKLAELEIRAPHNGIIVDGARNLHPGRWIRPQLQLAIVRSSNEIEFKALVDDKARRRLKPNAMGKFIPDEIDYPPVGVKTSSIADVTGTGIELAYLAEPAGSKVPIMASSTNTLQPVGAWFSIQLKPTDTSFLSDRVVRGVVVLEARPESLLHQIFRQIASVLVREAGI